MEHIGLYLKDIHTQEKSGDLVFRKKNIKKYLSFQNGFLVFARTNKTQELLEEILYKLGKISDETYLRLNQYKTPKSNIEDILIEKGLLTQRDLREALVYQMREIALNMFHIFDGNFYFQESIDFFGHPSKSKISVSVLIGDGIKRMKYNPLLKSWMENKTPFQIEKDFSFRLSEEEKTILKSINGKIPAGALFQSSNIVPESFWKSLYLFYCLGLVDIKGEKAARKESDVDFIDAVKASLKEDIDFVKEKGAPAKEDISDKDEEKPLAKEDIDFIDAVKVSLKKDTDFVKEEEAPAKEEISIESEEKPSVEEDISVEKKKEEAAEPVQEDIKITGEERLFAKEERDVESKEEPVREEERKEAPVDDSDTRIKEVLLLRQNMSTMDYYQILDVTQNASPIEIKRAYFQLARKYHPDRFSRDLPSEEKEAIEEVFGQITKAYNALGSDEKRKQYDTKEASVPRKGRKDQTKVAEIRFRQGKTLFNQGRYEEAQLLLEEAIRFNRNKGNYFLLLAMIESKIPQFHRKAERDFLKAIDFEPWNPEGFGGLGLLYKQEGLMARAKVQFKRALEIDPDYKIALKELGAKGKGEKKKGLKELLSKDIFGGKKKS